MVTYMEPQTVPIYMSVTFTRRTLRLPNFTHATHPQPSLSNFLMWDSNFGEPTHSRGTTLWERNFPTSPQNKNTKLTHCSIYTTIRTISFPQIKSKPCSPWLGSHKGANRELLEVYSNPQTRPLPGPPGSYSSGVSAHKFIQIK